MLHCAISQALVRCVSLLQAEGRTNPRAEEQSVPAVCPGRLTHGSSVVRCCDRSESLLSSRVPDLQFDALAVELDRLDLEINSEANTNRREEEGRVSTGDQRKTASTPSSSARLHVLLAADPMVVMKEVVKESSENRSSKHDLPTPDEGEKHDQAQHT